MKNSKRTKRLMSLFLIVLPLVLFFNSVINAKGFYVNLIYFETDKTFYYCDEQLIINASWELDYNPTTEISFIQIQIYNESNYLLWNSSKYYERGRSEKIWILNFQDFDISFNNKSIKLFVKFFLYFIEIVSGSEISTFLSTIEIEAAEKKSYIAQVYLNGIDKSIEKSIEISWNNPLNISITYKDQDMGSFINSANVELRDGDKILDTFIEQPTFNQYYLILNTSNMNLGINNRTIYAKQENYTSYYVELNISLNERTSYIHDIFLNGLNKTVKKFIVISWNKALNISIIYKDLETGIFIDNATIELQNKERILEFFSKNPAYNQYNAIINATDLNWEGNDLYICAQKKNYIPAIEIITVIKGIFFNTSNPNIQDLKNELGIHLEINANNEGFIGIKKQKEIFDNISKPNNDFSATDYYSFEVYDKNYEINSNIINNTTIRLYYNSNQIDDVNNLCLLKYEENKTWKNIEISINSSAYYVEFNSSNFSIYVLGEIKYISASSSSGNKDSGIDIKNDIEFPIWIILIIIIIGLIAIAGIIIKKRNNNKKKEEISTSELDIENEEDNIISDSPYVYPYS